MFIQFLAYVNVHQSSGDTERDDTTTVSLRGKTVRKQNSRGTQHKHSQDPNPLCERQVQLEDHGDRQKDDEKIHNDIGYRHGVPEC